MAPPSIVYIIIMKVDLINPHIFLTNIASCYLLQIFSFSMLMISFFLSSFCKRGLSLSREAILTFGRRLVPVDYTVQYD